MPDVMIVFPSVSYTAKHSEIKDDIRLDAPPLGMLYLAAACEKEGFTVKVFDTTSGFHELEKIMTEIKREPPKVLGLSSLTSTVRGAVQLAREVKRVYKDNIKIGLGGHHITTDPGIIDRYPVFDFGITGEGDITFVNIVKNIMQDKTQKGIFTGAIPSDLDTLPFPARHLINYTVYEDFRFNPIVTSRGCPYKCVYCSIPAIDRKLRFRKAEFVVEEMLQAYKTSGSKRFMFLDDTFSINRERTMLLCEHIINSGLQPMWNAMTRCSAVDLELLKLMKKAGCHTLLFGVESGNERIRNTIIQKRLSEKQIRDAFALCRKVGIESQMFLMLGFPTERKEEINDTINLPYKVEPDIVGIHLTIPLPGARIWHYAIENNIIPKNTIDLYIDGKLGEGFRKSWPRYVPEGLTIDDLREAEKATNRKFYLRLKYIFYRLLNDFTSIQQLKIDIRQAYSLARYGRSYLGE